METDKDMITSMSHHIWDRFKDEISELDKLIIEIQQMVRNPQCALEKIERVITDHITGYGEDVEEDINDDKWTDALLVAHNIVNDLLLYLEINETNYYRIRDYAYEFSLYEGFDLLIMNFRDIIPEDERKQLIEDGMQMFDPETMRHWEL